MDPLQWTLLILFRILLKSFFNKYKSLPTLWTSWKPSKRHYGNNLIGISLSTASLMWLKTSYLDLRPSRAVVCLCCPSPLAWWIQHSRLYMNTVAPFRFTLFLQKTSRRDNITKRTAIIQNHSILSKNVIWFDFWHIKYFITKYFLECF